MAYKVKGGSARAFAGCTPECAISMKYQGAHDGMYSFDITHNNETINVQVTVGTSVGEMQTALNRSLQEVAGHVRN
jgi:hypothetical protein